MTAELPKEQHMENIAIQKASQIDAAAREWLQRLFGRPLSEDEEVTIFVPVSHDAPSMDERKAAFRRADEVLDQAAENMRDVSDREFDEALDEAMQHIRKRTT
jgi:hypothetical protein